MNDKNLKIAFMDDEIFNDGAIIPNIAYEKLKNDGYDVTPFDTMGKLLEVFKTEYFDLFILDIDMSHVDEKIDGKNGISIGEILKMLSSLSKVVVFSARGVTDDMINAANYHFYKYIQKDDGVAILIDTIHAIENENDYIINFFIDKPEENRALLVYKENKYISENEAKTELNKHFDAIDVARNLKDAIELKKENQYTTILLVSEEFPNTQTISDNLGTLNDGDENLIFAVYADSDTQYIVPLVNLRPFRILNLRWENKIDKLNEFISKAIIWYGRDEIFEFPAQDDVCYKIIKNSKLSDAQKQEILAMQEELEEAEFELFEEDEEGELNE